MSLEKLTYEKNSLVCRKDDDDNDLFYIESGQLLVFGLEGTKVTPLAYIGAGEFVGELSFFDKTTRSAFVIAKEKSELIKIEAKSKSEYMPEWLTKLAQNLSKQIRTLDARIVKKGIRKAMADTIKPLTIDEQREILQIINQ